MPRTSPARSACLMVLLAAAVFAFWLPAKAQAPLVLVDEANPPFMFLSSEGRAAGIYPAIIAEAFRRMGRPVALEAIPWKRALVMLEHDQAGVGGIYKTEERLKKCDYSDSLYEERVLVVQTSQAATPFTGLGSLKGMRIGTLRGWSYGDAFDTARRDGLFEVEEVHGDIQNLGKLQTGRIDAMLAIKESAEAVIAASGTREIFVLHKKPLAENPAFLAFAKAGDRKALLESFNKALADMRRDGTLDTIVLSILARPR